MRSKERHKRELMKRQTRGGEALLFAISIDTLLFQG